MQRPYPNHYLPLTLAGLILLPALAFLWLRLATPFANDRLQPGTDSMTPTGLIVTPVDMPPAALQPGDVVTAIEGRSLETWAQALFTGGVDRPQWQAGETVRYAVLREGQPVDVDVALGRYPLTTIVGLNWGTILFALAFQLIAGYVFARRPGEPASRLLFLYASAILAATTWSLGMEVSDVVHGLEFWLFQLTTIGAYFLFWIFGLHFTLIFPRPLPLASQRWPLLIIYTAPYLLLFLYLLLAHGRSANTLDWIGRWGPTTGIQAAVFLSLILAVAIWQYRRNTQGATRQQVRWVLLGGLIAGGLGLLLYVLPPLFGRPAVNSNVMGVIILAFPLALAVAILRHNLFDIDTLLNRAMVYGALTAVVIAIYVLVVGALGAIFQRRGDLFVTLVATGAVAVAFQPLRDRLQRWINRLMYGERDEPFTVVTRLGRRLEATLSPEETLPTLVETVADTLRLPYVAIAVKKEEGGRVHREYAEGMKDEIVTEYGKPTASVMSFALAYQGQKIGQLIVAPRAPDEAFTSADLRLLENIARQAGTAVHAVQLTEQLRRSRQRIVTAREEERRRLRRDLHDGLGPQLASQTLSLDAVEKLLDKDPAAARELLRTLKKQAQDAIVDVRRLVYELRPPALDELGLAGALRESAARYENGQLRFTFDALPALPALPAAVEVAAYRIVQEAITNVVRHARASECTVKLAVHDGALVVEVTDNGLGLPAGCRSGVGLQSMRERAAELNGRCIIETHASHGTRILATLPITTTDLFEVE